MEPAKNLSARVLVLLLLAATATMQAASVSGDSVRAPTCYAVEHAGPLFPEGQSVTVRVSTADHMAYEVYLHAGQQITVVAAWSGIFDEDAVAEDCAYYVQTEWGAMQYEAPSSGTYYVVTADYYHDSYAVLAMLEDRQHEKQGMVEI